MGMAQVSVYYLSYPQIVIIDIQLKKRIKMKIYEIDTEHLIARRGSTIIKMVSLQDINELLEKAHKKAFQHNGTLEVQSCIDWIINEIHGD